MNSSEVSGTSTSMNSPLLRQILLREVAWHAQQSGGDIAAAIERELLEFQLELVETQKDRLDFDAQYLRGRLIRLDSPESTSADEPQPF